MESIIRDVPALEDTHRRSLEALLGQELHANQRVYIAVLPNSTEPAAEQRRRAWDELREIAVKAEANLRAQGISAEQWAALVDEECEAVRYGKKS